MGLDAFIFTEILQNDKWVPINVIDSIVVFFDPSIIDTVEKVNSYEVIQKLEYKYGRHRQLYHYLMNNSKTIDDTTKYYPNDSNFKLLKDLKPYIYYTLTDILKLNYSTETKSMYLEYKDYMRYKNEDIKPEEENVEWGEEIEIIDEDIWKELSSKEQNDKLKKAIVYINTEVDISIFEGATNHFYEDYIKILKNHCIKDKIKFDNIRILIGFSY
jgi:hypothetical protein